MRASGAPAAISASATAWARRIDMSSLTAVLPLASLKPETTNSLAFSWVERWLSTGLARAVKSGDRSALPVSKKTLRAGALSTMEATVAAPAGMASETAALLLRVAKKPSSSKAASSSTSQTRMRSTGLDPGCRSRAPAALPSSQFLALLANAMTSGSRVAGFSPCGISAAITPGSAHASDAEAGHPEFLDEARQPAGLRLGGLGDQHLHQRSGLAALPEARGDLIDDCIKHLFPPYP